MGHFAFGPDTRDTEPGRTRPRGTHRALIGTTERNAACECDANRPSTGQLWDAAAVSDDPTDKASDQYDRAEQAYITAIASGAGDSALRGLAQQVAQAAHAWESADNAADEPPGGVTRYYVLPEVLSTLWSDLADAYDRRA